jgi:subtilase family serine protease
MSIPGLAVYGSTGDGGFNGPDQPWPSELTTVIAAGGTSLYASSASPTGYAETGWSGGPGLFGNVGGGSGCAPSPPAANGQPAAIAADCGGHRAAADISSDADPFTGVAIYDTYTAGGVLPPEDWTVVGGTSAASPFLAGLNARAGVQANLNGPNYIYQAPASAFNDMGDQI